MTQKFSVTRFTLYIAVLCGLFAFSNLYKDVLYQKSHSLIKNLQEGVAHDGFLVRFMETFSEVTDDERMVLMFVAVSPLLSRERFWYYLIAAQFASFSKIVLKMIQSEPRPFGFGRISVACGAQAVLDLQVVIQPALPTWPSFSYLTYSSPLCGAALSILPSTRCLCGHTSFSFVSSQSSA